MNAIGARLRSVLSATRDRTDRTTEGDGNETERPESNLFHCSTCDVVYIATEKRTCSNCESAVERVPSTLTRE